MEKEICIEESGNAMEKLKACNPEYCFLGITADGGKCHSVPAPWDSTVACMNMKLPDVFLSPDVYNRQHYMRSSPSRFE